LLSLRCAVKTDLPAVDLHTSVIDLQAHPTYEDAVAAAQKLLKQLEAMQGEMDDLKAEVNLLRRRDETLNFSIQRFDEELRLAARLQQEFLPKQLPQVGRLHFHTLFRPAGYVSGDLYDVMRLDEKNVGFYMADAVGHGMPAALLTMFIKNALVTKQITDGKYRLLTPSETMSRLNEAMIEQNLSASTFATAIYGMIDTEALTVSFARGGHPHPMLMRADGTVAPLESDGCLLGVFAGEPYEQKSAQLAPGDRLIIYSDGVEVAFCDDQTIDPERWRHELKLRQHLSSEELLLDFANHVDNQAGSLAPKDDLTMIVVEVK
jgi:sigma-B regulation protein RsbU (phosphoserine phosphatase)